MTRITTQRIRDALFHRKSKVSTSTVKTKPLKIIVQGNFKDLPPAQRKCIKVDKAEFLAIQTGSKTTYCCRKIKTKDDYAELTLHRGKTTRPARGSGKAIIVANEPVSGVFTVTLKLGPTGPLETCCFDAIEYFE